jgi:hypothetical protein
MPDTWKQQLAEVLMLLKLTDKGFTGKIIINVSQGGVTSVQRLENLK